MRRSKGKLTSFNWQLVLFAGIFQILTFVFDQVVIQYEEKNRENNFQILTKSESRSAYLKMNNRVNDFMLLLKIQFFSFIIKLFQKIVKNFIIIQTYLIKLDY